MSRYTDTVNKDTPRLEIRFKRTPDGVGQYQWGICGNMPMLPLIGYLARVQTEIQGNNMNPCDHHALVIVWDLEIKLFEWFIHPDMPVDPTVGMLEIIKEMLVGSQLAQHMGAQRVQILGPDGNPMRGM